MHRKLLEEQKLVSGCLSLDWDLGWEKTGEGKDFSYSFYILLKCEKL
jgi:hypothetical protein